MEGPRSSNAKHASIDSGAKQSIDSGRRSVKQRLSKVSKISRDSRESKVSIIKEEEPAEEEQNINYRETITNIFFESFFSNLVAETKPIKIYDTDTSRSSLTMGISSTESTNESYISVLEGAINERDRGESSSSKEGSSQKTSIISSQSVTDSTGTNVSCASTCICCWKVVFKNGNVYEGQLKDNLLDGKGIFYWSDGSIYKGEFKDGYPCGYGKLILPDLSSYEGEFCMGFFHGFGTFNVKSTPVLYRGEWKLSQRNGKGWLLYESNNWYEGDWVNNVRHGNGLRQYVKGDRYKGRWINDKISGEGCMMWRNNDYYDGEWSEGYPHGYGEYTWNLLAHNCFVFPNYNWYKGSWVSGERTGAGIMNFGHESGAKLAGMWQQNKKHGAGVMVCGNGMVLEKNPLFTDDKPSTYSREDYLVSKFSTLNTENLDKKDTALKTYKSISKQVFSKEKLETLEDESLLNLTKSGTQIKTKQYIRLLEKNTENNPPLKIPIHNVIHEVDLQYFVEDFIRPGFIAKDNADISTMEIEHIINARTGSTYVSPSCMNYLPSNADLGPVDFEKTASEQCLPNTIELRNLIINFLPQLRKIYNVYATMCVEKDLSFEPVLVRMFLWQLYRDIGVTDIGGISIVEIDETLMRIPNSCLETVHSPWEHIYFWQFLQAMVGVACLLYSTENHLDYTPSSGFMHHMFKHFLEHRLLARAGIFQGNCLRQLKDLIPADTVYRLYKLIGEPHTVEEFLKNTCLKRGQNIPCYRVINSENTNEYTVQTGTNIVVLNHDLTYLEKSHTKVNIENNKEKGYEGLYTFSCLGRKKILKSLSKICPQILLPTGRYQLRYKLSFIEFYEALLLLSFEKVEKERLALFEELKTQSISEVKTTMREMSRISTHSAKKKKFKK